MPGFPPLTAVSWNPAFDAAAAGYYKILQVQHLLDEDGQPVTDLTLERVNAIDEP